METSRQPIDRIPPSVHRTVRERTDRRPPEPSNADRDCVGPLPALDRLSSSTAVATPERLALSVEEAAALLGISRTLGYELVARGELPSLRLGRRIVVPRAALEALLSTAARPEGT